MTRRALVTGSDGFIGRHITAALDAHGWDVYAVDLAHPRHPVDAVDFFRDPAYAANAMHFDLVVHCAALVGGRKVIEGQQATLAARDLALDAAMFEWAMRARPGRIVYFSSSAAYPMKIQGQEHLEFCRSLVDWGGKVDERRGYEALTPEEQAAGVTFTARLREDDIDLDNARQPDSSYGWVKLTGERLARWATDEADLTVHVFRPFSGYGHDQDPAYPFPAYIARAARREAPFDVWGLGDQCRDFIHVDDIVGAVLAAVEHDVRGPVNLGTGRATSFNELAQLVMEAAGYTTAIRHLPAEPVGAFYRVADPTRLLDFYVPKVTLEEGIERALAAWEPAA